VGTRDELEHIFISNVGPIIFRVVWWNYLDRTKRPHFAEELFDAIVVGIVKAYEVDSNTKLPDGAAQLLRPLVRSMVEAKIGDYASCIREFGDDTYETVVKRLVGRREESSFYRLFASQYDLFTSRIAHLSDELIAAVRVISEEFIIWLKSHSDQSNQIHSDAFEQLTGEILASQGFDVQFTGRIKNRSADLIAIERTEQGAGVKYLVECKRYGETSKVGIDILNAVVGASFRAGTSHAMLVTTRSFTSNVFQARAELHDFRLELHDGRRVVEWLSDYEFKDFGLWLPDGWKDNWTSR
jgi:HJR/Mrr/RecB family endonuclease